MRHLTTSQMHPTERLILPVVLSSLLLGLLVHRALASCEPAACGNLTVRHPFWLSAPGGDPPPASVSCAPPSFEVSCASNGSVASLGGIDYGSSTFVVSHNRVADGNNGVCGTDFNNCNSTEPRGDEYVNATSSCGKLILAYLGGSYDRDRPSPIPAGNCTFTYLPVLGSCGGGHDKRGQKNYASRGNEPTKSEETAELSPAASLVVRSPRHRQTLRQNCRPPLQQRDPHPMSSSMATAGPKPSEVYGFVGSISTVITTGVYLVWAYTPEPCLHSLGITYYPTKYFIHLIGWTLHD